MQFTAENYEYMNVLTRSVGRTRPADFCGQIRWAVMSIGTEATARMLTLT